MKTNNETMTAEHIAKKYVHGLHDALTDRQEIKDMMTDIETYAESYHQAKLKLLGIGGVVGQSEQLKAEVFTLANKLAGAGEGDAAVAMHRIHNRL